MEDQYRQVQSAQDTGTQSLKLRYESVEEF